MREQIPSYCRHSAEEIFGFFGPYRFLSNFWNCPVEIEGITYQNTEAAFQALKTLNHEVRKKFAHLGPREAKALGRKILLRKDWDTGADREAMKLVIHAKFTQNAKEHTWLKETGSAILTEANHWGDRKWGTDPHGKGTNLLGQTLMEERRLITNA